MRGSVVVLNWNGRELLARCLPPLLESMERCEGEWELIVVDNGSHDGSVEFLRDRHPEVSLLENTENRGFSAAANQGIRAARGELVAMLNNDVVVTPTWLRELVAVLDADLSLGSAAAQMRYLNDPDLVNSAGITVDVSGRAYDRSDGAKAESEPKAPERVFGASAGAALYRRDLLDTLDGFDERFFAYLEDVDLAWRLQRLGWGCAYVPTSVVLHEHSATSRRIGGLKTYLSVRNHWWLVAKNASRPHLIAILPLLLALGCWTALTAAFEKRDLAGVRGLRDAVAGLPAFVRERPAGEPLPMRAFPKPSFFRYRRSERAPLRA